MSSIPDEGEYFPSVGQDERSEHSEAAAVKEIDPDVPEIVHENADNEANLPAEEEHQEQADGNNIGDEADSSLLGPNGVDAVVPSPSEDNVPGTNGTVPIPDDTQSIPEWTRKEEARRDRRWRRSESSADEDDGARGKGKATSRARVGHDENTRSGAIMGGESVGPGPIVVFSCRHLYHQKCLSQEQGPMRGHLENGGPGLVCPSCV